MKMGLLHDVQESIVGDITPFCGVSDEKKHDLEMKAAEIFAAQQPEMKELFDEYEANTTQEAKFVHDCDKLDMLIQAWIYEQQQGVKLDQFFEHCDLPKSFDVLIQVRKEIERCRAK
ncbi:Metal_dependent phosphohydrolase [Hexamita inflata]|uniref:Putative n=1 Tax=Hexamita inflata TaxID=28002 RepID=A0AA86NFD9_9EUKA|nr:Metal dependent phosphohydrolase [Hexamita inflata]